VVTRESLLVVTPIAVLSLAGYQLRMLFSPFFLRETKILRGIYVDGGFLNREFTPLPPILRGDHFIDYRLFRYSHNVFQKLFEVLRSRPMRTISADTQ
jgi:hypothetical protein